MKHPLSGVLVLSLSFLLFLASCLDETYSGDPEEQPVLSTDTLSFDTVLTEISTVTRFLKIINPHDKFLEIDEVSVTGEGAKFFNLNVDGRPGKVITNVRVAPNDSIYVFVEANIDPTQPDNVSPYFIEANLSVRRLGREVSAVLLAYGQNANYIPGPDQPNRILILTCDLQQVVWDDPKPYVLYGTLLIDSCTLVLPAGTRLYVHGGIANNQIGIYQDGLIYTLPNGRIVANGTLQNPVIIRDDRIEPDYAGVWAGVRLGPSSGPHTFNFTHISQGAVGIYADSASQLTVSNSIIFNTDGPGLLTRHAKADITNSLFYSNGFEGIALTFGGEYSINYCTVANFGNTRSAIHMSNFHCYDPLCEVSLLNPLSAQIANSIFVGSSTDEISISDANKDDSSFFGLEMKGCIVVTNDLLKPQFYPDFFTTICNPCYEWSLSDPLFKSISMDDYHLDSLSLALQKALPLPFIMTDIEGNSRDAVTPDIGCYESQD